MFGVSFGEMAMIAVVALLVVGPKRLPEMMRSMGSWIRKIRLLTTEVREKTGIDDILRTEGIDGGLAELRSLLRGDLLSHPLPRPRHTELAATSPVDPYMDLGTVDPFREYPTEGPDANGALPDDLVPAAPAEPKTRAASSAGEGQGSAAPALNALVAPLPVDATGRDATPIPIPGNANPQ